MGLVRLFLIFFPHTLCGKATFGGVLPGLGRFCDALVLSDGVGRGKIFFFRCSPFKKYKNTPPSYNRIVYQGEMECQGELVH